MSERRLQALADHPRAGAAIRRAKGIGGLAGFALACAAGFLHGIGLVTLLERALAVGVLAYLLAWAAALVFWRRVLTAEALAAVVRAREGVER